MELKCVKCRAEGKEGNALNKETPVAEYIYHGFSVCHNHYAKWHNAVLEEIKQGQESKMTPRIVTPDSL